MVYYCSVVGCKSSSITKTVLMRRFPPPSSHLFNQWVLATGNEALQKLDPKYIRTNKRVCNLHFPIFVGRLPIFRNEYYPPMTENLISLSTNAVNMQFISPVNTKDLDSKSVASDVNALTLNQEISAVNDIDVAIVKQEINAELADIITTKSVTTQTIESCFTKSSINLNGFQCKPLTLDNNVTGPKCCPVVVNNTTEMHRNLMSASKLKCEKCARHATEIRKMKTQVRNLKLAKEKLKAECKQFADFQYLDERVKNFMRSQLTNADKKTKGETYSHEDKIFALSIYRLSKECYNFLSKVFTLPCLSTLKNLKRENPDLRDVTKCVSFETRNVDFGNANVLNSTMCGLGP